QRRGEYAGIDAPVETAAAHERAADDGAVDDAVTAIRRRARAVAEINRAEWIDADVASRELRDICVVGLQRGVVVLDPFDAVATEVPDHAAVGQAMRAALRIPDHLRARLARAGTRIVVGRRSERCAWRRIGMTDGEH